MFVTKETYLKIIIHFGFTLIDTRIKKYINVVKKIIPTMLKMLYNILVR